MWRNNGKQLGVSGFLSQTVSSNHYNTYEKRIINLIPKGKMTPEQ